MTKGDKKKSPALSAVFDRDVIDRLLITPMLLDAQLVGPTLAALESGDDEDALKVRASALRKKFFAALGLPPIEETVAALAELVSDHGPVVRAWLAKKNSEVRSQ